MATLKEQFQVRKQESANQLNNLYNSKLAATQESIASEYEPKLSDLQASKDKIAPEYRTAANNLAAAYERNRRNMMMSATVNGLANGTQQQQQNALRNQYTSNYGALMGQRAAAETEADRKIANLLTAYNNSMTNAEATNATERAAEMIKERERQNEWYATQAKNLAQFGDFSGYASIYGQEQAAQMEQAWIAQNPLLAYRTGKISAAQYQQMTGKSPV